MHPVARHPRNGVAAPRFIAFQPLGEPAAACVEKNLALPPVTAALRLLPITARRQRMSISVAHIRFRRADPTIIAHRIAIPCSFAETPDRISAETRARRATGQQRQSGRSRFRRQSPQAGDPAIAVLTSPALILPTKRTVPWRAPLGVFGLSAGAVQ